TYYYRLRSLTGSGNNPGSGPKSKWVLASSTTNSVSNQTPTVSADAGSVTVNEGQTATMTGTYSDPDASDNVTITAWGTTTDQFGTVTVTGQIGAVTKTGTNSGTWTWTFPTTDGPAQSQQVIIQAQDTGNSGLTSPAVSSTNFDLAVMNVAPALTAPFNQSSLAGVLTSFTL